jgi:hypothetical protein
MSKLIASYNFYGKIIHLKDSDGYKSWSKYDENNYNTFYLNTNDQVFWYKYSIFVENNDRIIFN